MLGSRKTDADKAGSKHSPNRQLDEPLFLITQNKEDNTKWQFPQGPVEPEETLRQVRYKTLCYNSTLRKNMTDFLKKH